MVVKAQLAADLMGKDDQQQYVRRDVDPSKPIYACKIYDTEKFVKEDLDMVIKEVKINSMVRSEFCVRHF